MIYIKGSEIDCFFDFVNNEIGEDASWRNIINLIIETIDRSRLI